MNIVGGTYDEIVVVPDSYDVAGSGMRAAAALSGRPMPPTLYTALDADIDEEARLTAAALGVTLGQVAPRDERVAFRYLTPISTPAVNGPSARITERWSVDGERTALVFGFIEDPAFEQTTVTAETIVLDPQRPRDADPLNLASLTAREFVIVANTNEMMKLGGRGRHGTGRPSVRDAAERLLHANPQVRSAITKRGASGCIVTWRTREGDFAHEAIGAHPTNYVWPIGSGDCFSAGVAHAIDSGADAVQAARVGSASAAHWCSTRVASVPVEILRGDFTSLPRPLTPAAGQVYLAGPFFSVAERWLIETVREELIALGVTPWSPVHEVGPGGNEVAQQDLEGLRNSDSVLALLDHSDPGTVFEVGWAVRENLPIVGFADTLDADGAKMMAGSTVELHDDISTACYRAAWAAMGLRVRPGWAHK